MTLLYLPTLVFISCPWNVNGFFCHFALHIRVTCLFVLHSAAKEGSLVLLKCMATVITFLTKQLLSLVNQSFLVS